MTKQKALRILRAWESGLIIVSKKAKEHYEKKAEEHRLKENNSMTNIYKMELEGYAGDLERVQRIINELSKN